MNAYVDKMTEARMEKQLESLDMGFVIESISAQIEHPLENKIKRNFLKRYEKQYQKIKEVEENTPDLDGQRETLHLEIISSIASAYDLEINTEDVDIPKLVKNMYKFFVVEIMDNIIQFLEMYIIENKEELSGMLTAIAPNNVTYTSLKESFRGDDDLAKIVSSISEAVHIVVESNISFEYLIELLTMHNDSSAASRNIYNYYLYNISENSNLQDTIFKPIVNDDEGYTNILNELQINLCRKFADV
jgi:hypothetical protein